MSGQSYSLRLYISGRSGSGDRAAASMRHLCSEVLGDMISALDIIDVREHPELAEEDKILATPTLIRKAPPPPRRLIGDLTDLDRVLSALELNQDLLPGSGESSR